MTNTTTIRRWIVCISRRLARRRPSASLAAVASRQTTATSRRSDPPRSRRTRGSSTSPKRTRARARTWRRSKRPWRARGWNARARRTEASAAPSRVESRRIRVRVTPVRGHPGQGHPGQGHPGSSPSASPALGLTDDETTARAPVPGATTPQTPQAPQTPRTPLRTPPGPLPSGTPPPRTPATSSSGATGLDFSSFLPGARAAPPASPRPLADESEVLARLSGADRAVVADVFAARLVTLRATRDRWIAGDVRGAAAALTRAGDDSAVVDVCRGALESRTATNPGGDALTLELAAALVPLAAPLLRSPHARARGRGASVQSVSGGGVR